MGTQCVCVCIYERTILMCRPFRTISVWRKVTVTAITRHNGQNKCSLTQQNAPSQLSPISNGFRRFELRQTAPFFETARVGITFLYSKLIHYFLFIASHIITEYAITHLCGVLGGWEGFDIESALCFFFEGWGWEGKLIATSWTL